MPDKHLALVNGNIVEKIPLSAQVNVESLTANKTLVPGIDKVYQYLDPNGANRIITLDTASAQAGDRFVIRNTAGSLSSYYLQIQQGSTILDYAYSQSIKEFIFDGTNWVSGDIGTGNTNIAIGGQTKGYASGIAIGYNAVGYNIGVTIGFNTYSSSYGVAVGSGASSSLYGVAVGYNAYSNSYGVAIGNQTKGMRYGVAIGSYAGTSIDTTADRYNVVIGAYAGFRLTFGIGNIILGYQSGYDAAYSPTTGSKNILIGFQAGTPANDTSNFLNIGNLIFATGVNTATGASVSNGQVSIGATASLAKLAIVSGSATEKGLVIRGATSQTANLLELQNNVGTVLTSFDASGNLQFSGNNIITDTTTGTKIGTASNQKLGFFGATPIIQPSTAGQVAGHTAGTGTTVTDDSTFTGGMGTTAYTIGDVVKHLKNLGLLAS